MLLALLINNNKFMTKFIVLEFFWIIYLSIKILLLFLLSKQINKSFFYYNFIYLCFSTIYDVVLNIICICKFYDRIVIEPFQFMFSFIILLNYSKFDINIIFNFCLFIYLITIMIKSNIDKKKYEINVFT
jgi:hypothetical protein